MQINTNRRRQIIAVALITIFVSSANAKVGRVPLRDLVKCSPIIVLAKVSDIEQMGSYRIATAKVFEWIRGSQGNDQVRFLASPTWECDVSDASKEEEVLLLLQEFSIARDAESQALSKRLRLAGKRCFLIAHSGRGRIPILRSRTGEQWARRPSDVYLPPTLSKLTRKQYDGVYRLPLDQLVAAIKNRMPKQEREKAHAKP